MSRRVLVIAAHPDDELLGCGGTLALHTRAGDEVTAVVACEGESRPLGFPDQRLDTQSLLDLVVPLERTVRELRPAVVYCQFGGDANQDHALLFRAALVATRPIEPFIEAVYAFDTASSTEWGYPRSFVPDTWVDISTTLEQKIAAMACYESEVRPYPHPRSLDALRHRARAWGNQCCMDAAEVFMTVRRTLRAGAAV